VRALSVDELVIRKNEMRAVADIESAFDVDSVGDELVDLGEQCVRIEHDTVADCAAHALMQNAARDLVEDERGFAEVDGVAGVRATLVADDPVSALREDVDEFALPFVAPLGADDHDRAIG
jgi:hypothetical protein